MPAEVAYFDSAAYSALPHAVRDAGAAGIGSKVQPWARSRDANEAWAERARGAAARLLGAGPDDVALVGSVSQGIAAAVAALSQRDVPPGSRLLRLADEHSSIVLALDRLARERGATVEPVPRPDDADWTAAVLEAIRRPGAAPISVAALTPLHWTDGALVDLDRIAPVLRAQGSVLLIDATQTAGVLPVDVRALRPDFVVFPTYKWLLGPYGFGLLYAAPHRQAGRPLDEHAVNRPGAQFAPGARRYDRGERNDPVNLPMAATGMELLERWTPNAVAATLGAVTRELAERLGGLVVALPERLRAPHILGLRLPGHDTGAVVQRLAERGVFASDRMGVLRVSPHVWVEAQDIARFTDGLRAVLAGAA